MYGDVSRFRQLYLQYLGSAPAAPPASTLVVYADSAGKLYWKDAAGAVYEVAKVSGGLVTQNKSADYTFVLADANTGVIHPSADVTGRTFTVPANSAVAFPVGTMLTIVNENGAGNITIAITTDTLRWSPAGTVGSRTLAPNGIATLFKVSATSWLISGTGLT